MAHGGTIKGPELFTTNSFCRAATPELPVPTDRVGEQQQGDPPLTTLSSLTRRDVGHRLRATEMYKKGEKKRI